jgi:hypothetical protein
MTVRRKPVLRKWKVLNTQHRTKGLFRDALSLPNELCDGTRLSWGGLSDNELGWIHGLLPVEEIDDRNTALKAVLRVSPRQRRSR